MKLITLLCCMALPLFSAAQSRYGNTPTDSLVCIKNLSLYREYFKQRNYQYAAPYWRKTLKTCPAAREYIYTDGVKIYEAFIKEHRDDSTKRHAYVDSILLLLDQRIQHFGKASYVNSLKGWTLLKHHSSEYQKAHAYFETAYEQEGENAATITMIGLFKSSLMKYTKQKDPEKKNALKVEIKSLFAELTAICEKKIIEYRESNSRKAQSYEKCLTSLRETAAQVLDR